MDPNKCLQVDLSKCLMAMEVGPQVGNNLLPETTMGCEWVVQVVMVHQAVVILVPMDVRTTFHLVIRGNISSTVMVDLSKCLQVPVSSLKAWAHPVLWVRDPPIILRGRNILQCLCHSKWAKEVIQVLIAIMARLDIMDHQVVQVGPRVVHPADNHRACNLRQIQVIRLLRIRTRHRQHRTDIRQIVRYLEMLLTFLSCNFLVRMLKYFLKT